MYNCMLAIIFFILQQWLKVTCHHTNTLLNHTEVTGPGYLAGALMDYV